MLTPLDVKRQHFTKQRLGGYDPDQVHAFLERVATELESEKEKQRVLENQAKDLEKKLEHYERVELALQEALETARETARVAQEAAEKRARIVLDEAELRAQGIVRDAEAERHSLRQDLSRITNKQKEVTAKMRAFLLSELELLANFEGDEPVGFLKLETSSGGARQLNARTSDEGEIDENATGDLTEDEGTEITTEGEEDAGHREAAVASDDQAEDEEVDEEVLLDDNEHPETAQGTPTESVNPDATDSTGHGDSEIDWESVSSVESDAGAGEENGEEAEAENVASEESRDQETVSEIEVQPEELEVEAAQPDHSTGSADRERIRRILEDLD